MHCIFSPILNNYTFYIAFCKGIYSITIHLFASQKIYIYREGDNGMEKKTQTSIAENIKKYRLLNNMTQKELSEKQIFYKISELKKSAKDSKEGYVIKEI